MKLQLKEKGSLLAQRVLTGSNLSNALSVTNAPDYKSFRNISYTCLQQKSTGHSSPLQHCS